MNRHSLLLLMCLVLAAAVPGQALNVNVALGGPAFANGPIWSGDTVFRLTDGNRLRQIHGEASVPDGFAYWIDLGRPQTLTSIRIWPRQDCCFDRLSNFRVSVHDDDGTGNIGAEEWFAELYTDGSNPGTNTVTVTDIMGTGFFEGRWVKLTSLASPVPAYALQVCELEVYAEGIPNLAAGAAVSANQPLWQGLPSALVDGDHSTLVHGNENLAPGYAYTLNIGASISIDQIKIIARQDGCCPDRLSNYRLSVHQDDGGLIGPEVWAATLHTDGSTPGSGPGAKDILTADLDPGGFFEGQWVKIESLADPVPNYALQIAEVEVYGTVPPLLQIVQQPQDVASLPPRSATFFIQARVLNGDPNLVTYQWQENGVDLPDATNVTYVTPPLTPADETNLFNCVVSYPGLASLTSEAAGVDFDYALGAAASSNQPLYDAWTMAQLVDGNRNNIIHGDANLLPGFAYDINLGVRVTISRLVIWARQDGLVPERLKNYRVSVHADDQGAIGPAVWSVDLHTDGSNSGSGPGAKDVLTADLDPGGLFEGQWIRIVALDEPVPDYSLQMNELEVFGSVPPEPVLVINQQPANVSTAPLRTATFNIAANVINGLFANIAYQWQKNGTDIPTATNASYTTPPLCAGENAATFRCVVSHPGAVSVTSAAAQIAFNYNYAPGAVPYSNQPIWPDFDLRWLMDGNANSQVHGVANLTPGFAYTLNLGLKVALSNIVVWARQDGCCSDRLSNYRVSVHEDAGSVIGAEVWGANLHADGSTPGSGPGAQDVVVGDQDPAGRFEGQWIKIMSLADPVPDYALQIGELEIFGLAQLSLGFVRAGDGLQLVWPAGLLESADTVAGPWDEVVGASSPKTVLFEGRQKFFRVSCGP